MIEIDGEHLGAPARVTIDGDRVTWSYSIKPLHQASRSAPVDELTVSLAPARWRGLQPAHPILILGGIGMLFVHLAILGAAIAAGALANALYRWFRPPQVLVLSTAADRFELVVARRSLADARAFATARAVR
jgi:hypothetical protein